MSERKLKNAKYFRLNADVVRDAAGGGCRYLSERTQQLVLPLVEMQKWLTRWSGEVTTDEVEAWVAQAVYEISADGGEDCASECYDFGPEVEAVTWEPQNPYTDPFLTPDGYLSPPFTVVKSTDVGLIALGLSVGDVITDITRFPNGSLPTIVPPGGFARFRVQFIGREIELHLLQIPGGGIATISTDGDPLTLATIDLNKDIFSLPVETVTVVTHQVEFPTTSAHFVDVTFIPWVNDEFPFLNYGGGIRSFTVCGAFGATMFDVRQNEDEPCTLEKTIDGETWVPWADLQLCPPLMRYDPTTGRYLLSKDGGLTWEDVTELEETDPTEPTKIPPPKPRKESTPDLRRCNAAANAENVLHSVFNETADGINITGNTATNVASGLGLLLATLLFIPVFGWIGLVPILVGAIAASVAFNRADYTGTTTDDVLCILFCNSTDNNGTVTFNYQAVGNAFFGKFGTAPFASLTYILEIIGPEGLDRAGGTTAVTNNSCDCPDCVEYCAGDGCTEVKTTYQPSYTGFSVTARRTYQGRPSIPVNREITIDLGESKCIKEVRLTYAGNSGLGWAGLETFIGGVSIGQGALNSSTVCTPNTANRVRLEDPVIGRYIRFYATSLIGNNQVTGLADVHCVTVTTCE